MKLNNQAKISAKVALLSFPIALFGLLFSYAIAHGSLLILKVLNFPALLIWQVMGSEHPEILQVIVVLLGQYLVYIGIIYCALAAATKWKKYKRNNQ